MDLVCGRAAFVDQQGRILAIKGEPWDWPRMRRYQTVMHPGLLHHRRLFDTYGPFDENLAIAGDYDFLLRISPQVQAAFVDEVVVALGATGVSTRRFWKALTETRRVQASRPEIGAWRAWMNFAVGLSKAVVRMVRWRSR